MSANQCGRYPFGILGNPLIYEKFSVCSLRAEGMSGLYAVITECCAAGSTIRHFQCWNYCAVEESAFPTWLSCVSAAIGTSEGSHCQRADESPVSTATSFPVSFQQPVSPPPFTWPIITVTTTTTTAAIVPPSVTAITTQLPALAARAKSKPQGGSQNSSTQATGSAPPTSKALNLSMAGVLCAILALSVFAL